MMRCLIALCLLATFTSNARGANRNVLLIIADDLGRDGACFGNDLIPTPNLDKLAGEGTRFSHAFATVASCSPSRAVLLTGLYTHQNGQYGLAHAVNNVHTKPNVQSLPKLLRENGYRTAILGKNHVLPKNVYPYETSFETGPAEPARDVSAMAKRAGEYFVSKDDARPFFLVVGLADTHRAGKGFGNRGDYPGVTARTYDPKKVRLPAFLPDDPDVRSDLADYYQSLDRLDQAIGMLMEQLERAGKRDDTLVFFVSDNGIPFPGAKTNLYDAGIHLPMLLRVPGKSGGVVSRAMVSWIDVAPTVLEFAGVAPPKNLAGRSLLPIAADENPSGWDTIFASHVTHEITMYYPMRAIRTRTHKLIWNLAHELPYPIAGDINNSPSWQAILKSGQMGGRTRESYLHRAEFELFDLEKDPDELKNVAGDAAYADVLADLKARLTKKLADTNDPWLAAERRAEAP